MKKRVFLAIDLPEKVKKTFAEFFQDVGDVKEVKWERAEKLHLTIVFLGFIDEKKIPQLALILKGVAVRHKKLVLTVIPAVSAFPTISNPRVLWLPLEGNLTLLETVAKKLSKKLKEKKIVFDKRKFSAHLTIGRFRGGIRKWQKQDAIKIIKNALPKGAIEFTVSGITLFESKLRPKGSIYNVLAYENFGN